jgi:hypothetical protein
VRGRAQSIDVAETVHSHSRIIRIYPSLHASRGLRPDRWGWTDGRDLQRLATGVRVTTATNLSKKLTAYRLVRCINGTPPMHTESKRKPRPKCAARLAFTSFINCRFKSSSNTEANSDFYSQGVFARGNWHRRCRRGRRCLCQHWDGRDESRVLTDPFHSSKP